MHPFDAEVARLGDGARVVVHNDRDISRRGLRVRIRGAKAWCGASIWWPSTHDGRTPTPSPARACPISVATVFYVSRRGRRRLRHAPLLYVSPRFHTPRCTQVRSRGTREGHALSKRNERELARPLGIYESLFPGLIGYDDSVVPQLVNAILARHNFILLGLRGQAKSRILRSLGSLMDHAIPIVAGSEINDNPYAPISKFATRLIAEAGDDTPIAWVSRDQRFVEKLATPDVTIADIIGDVDPIKAAKGGHILADELTMHYGMLPRANVGSLR